MPLHAVVTEPESMQVPSTALEALARLVDALQWAKGVGIEVNLAAAQAAEEIARLLT